MAKTYIQLINEVGKNLRRSNGTTYTTLTQDQNAVSIAQFLNQAKRLVEDRWKWHQLRKTVTFDSVGGTATYDTSSLSIVTSDPTVTTDRTHLLYDARRQPLFWDVTDANAGFRLSEVTREHALNCRRLSTENVSKPWQFASYQNGSGLTILFPYAPEGVRNYSFEAYIPQDELASTSTTLECPWRPVVLAATAMACEERGEEFGNPGTRWWDEYEIALGAAISSDSLDSDFTLIPD